MLSEEQVKHAREFACQILVSRLDMMPGSEDVPDRMERKQAGSMASARQYGQQAADIWRKKHKEPLPADGEHDDLALLFAAHIANHVLDGSTAQSKVDAAVSSELWDEVADLYGTAEAEDAVAIEVDDEAIEADDEVVEE